MLETYDADFIDARIETRKSTAIALENHSINNAIKEEFNGIFIRVYKGRKWYYTSLNSIDKDRIANSLKELVSLADRKNSRNSDFYSHLKAGEFSKIIYENNPTDISVDEKKKLIYHYDSLMKNNDKIKFSSSMYVDVYSMIYYGDSAGRFTQYDFTGAEVRASFMMSENDERFMGSYKQYSDDFNALTELDQFILEEIKETETFIHADTAKQDIVPVILSPSAAGVFAHESFGHKSEADFMIGDRKMKEEWVIGKHVGSNILSIIDDGGVEHASGYTPFDDEGTPAHKTYLIKNGILSDRLHSLSTAFDLNEKPTGNGRAMNTEYEPIVRMTSTYIEKGDSSFNDLVKSIDNGYYIKSIKHGSGMSTFTIAPHKSYKIKKGKITDPVKINVITGTVFETLNLIDGLSDQLTLKSSITGGCGKMEQFPLRVSFGGPEVRISKMNIS